MCAQNRNDLIQKVKKVAQLVQKLRIQFQFKCAKQNVQKVTGGVN